MSTKFARIPGNIGDDVKMETVVAACKERHIPIRIGVNTGSLENDLVNQYGRYNPEALVESAMRKVRLLEEMGFEDIVISLKSSEVAGMVEAYRLMSQKVRLSFASRRHRSRTLAGRHDQVIRSVWTAAA